MPLKLALILAFCGFAATAAHARKPAEPLIERILSVGEDGSLQLEKSGKAAFAGLYFPDPARTATYLDRQVGETLAFLPEGQDRYGRVMIRGAQSEALLKEGLAVIYDTKAAPESWASAEAKGATKWPAHWTVTAEQAEDHRDEFRMVKGTVQKIFQTREKTYVNFGPDWHTDFSITIPKHLWRSFGDMKTLEGKQVRVRGTIYSENGPMIAITHPSQLEIIE